MSNRNRAAGPGQSSGLGAVTFLPSGGAIFSGGPQTVGGQVSLQNSSLISDGGPLNAVTEVIDFANALATGAIDQVEKIDTIITRHAANWRLDRMAVVDRNLLRLATYEFLSHQEMGVEMPVAVVINEALEIARRFSAAESPQFINGILDSIRKEVEK